MATAEKTTREQVEELYDKGTTEAKAIAKALNLKQPTVYVHLRKIQAERGIKPRGRGRPPKVETQNGSSSKPAPRKAPPKADQTQAEAKRKPGRPKRDLQKLVDRANGSATAEEFPAIKQAIETELAEHRRAVTKLERMLAAFGS